MSEGGRKGDEGALRIKKGFRSGCSLRMVRREGWRKGTSEREGGNLFFSSKEKGRGEVFASGVA